MYHPTTRLLTVLELLQTHGQMTGTELARRLEVDTRTIRRYVLMLQEIGIPVEAEMGRYGGYVLRAGFKLPPMMFNNDEAFALILGLLTARQMGFVGAAVEGTLAKLYRVLPDSLRETVRSIDSALTIDIPLQQKIQQQWLVVLSQGVHMHRAVDITYRRGDEISQRRVDPFGLVVYEDAVYLIGYCHLRHDTRVFRLDRIDEARLMDETFVPPSDFDALGYLVASIATMPDKWSVEVVLKTSLDKARQVIPGGLGLMENHTDGVLLRTGTQDIDWMARYLVGLGFPVTIHEPPELRAAFERLAATLLDIARR